MRFESTRARAIPRKARPSVDEQSCVAKFPKRIVQDAVDRMRRAYDNPDRLPARMSVRYAHIRSARSRTAFTRNFTTSAGGFCVYIWDFQGRRRPATMDDVHLLHPPGEPAHRHRLHRPPRVRPGGPFPVGRSAWRPSWPSTRRSSAGWKPSAEDVPYLIEIGSIVKGGLEALKREPILVGYSEAKSPLCLDSNMADIFVEYIESGDSPRRWTPCPTAVPPRPPRPQAPSWWAWRKPSAGSCWPTPSMRTRLSAWTSFPRTATWRAACSATQARTACRCW